MLKRIFDITLAALLLILISPLLAMIAVAVLLESGRPVIFSQYRVGRHFRRFKIFKFRSMRVDSKGPAITTATDPRITKVGRFLRMSKWDELPQLWNVLIGEMSLVGPRPEVQQYVDAFRDRYRSILEVRPGITDLASVRYRREEQVLAAASDPLRAYEEVVLPGKLDLADEYLSRRSLFLDISILWHTLCACCPLHTPMPIERHVKQILERVESRGRIRRPLVWTVQIAVFLLSGLSAFLLRFDYTVPSSELAHLALALPVWVLVKAIAFRKGQLDSGWWGSVSIFDVSRIGTVTFAASAVSAVPLWLITRGAFPRSVYALDFLTCFLAIAGVRMTFRLVMESVRGAKPSDSAKRTIIYGAGESGGILLREMRRGGKELYRVCGFVDDDPAKRKDSVQGIPVLGTGAQLAELVRSRDVQHILIAIPSASGQQMTQILTHCSQAGVPYKTVPSLTEIVRRDDIVKQIRDVAVEDLLGRSPVSLDVHRISRKIHGRVVVVTGAGGSIGSELCRQLSQFSPKAIVGYDTSETALFHLDVEMRERFPHVAFHAEIGSTQNASRFSEVLQKHRPALLYHAAAYKHVPLLESHVVEAVENNVLATATVARLAAEHGLEDFVMISTDKAVQPTSILGATKRVAELIVNSFEGASTKFVSVRFGNVLGSNGSVIPLFKKQIAAGGPVTVTHPDMLRYFMTIPEAAQLVLQASAMDRGGEIFVLDMGQPMKILDLARNLIILSGMRPEQDIKIVFTGLRPGEKLREELASPDELILPTEHDKIRVFRGTEVSAERIKRSLQTLAQACATRDVAQLILALKDIAPEYNPSTNLLRQVIQQQSETSSLAALASGVGLSRNWAPETALLEPSPSPVIVSL